ncbi:hypothetical protein [Streptomyces sp. Ag109_O5-10]|uniref:hypothetical protein n=1 Tax=Streptomyces sp. Ag109_O5-10 TaxID=1855349 RepID=UPI00115F79ED|nr:hypothetical protein [Streptomyces sp. Ag109_O5-10]
MLVNDRAWGTLPSRQDSVSSGVVFARLPMGGTLAWHAVRVDDLIGTRAPRRRLYASVDAIEELERAVPALVGHRRSLSADIN